VRPGIGTKIAPDRIFWTETVSATTTVGAATTTTRATTAGAPILKLTGYNFEGILSLFQLVDPTGIGRSLLWIAIVGRPSSVAIQPWIRKEPTGLENDCTRDSVDPSSLRASTVDSRQNVAPQILEVAPLVNTVNTSSAVVTTTRPTLLCTPLRLSAVECVAGAFSFDPVRLVRCQLSIAHLSSITPPEYNRSALVSAGRAVLVSSAAWYSDGTQCGRPYLQRIPNRALEPTPSQPSPRRPPPRVVFQPAVCSRRSGPARPTRFNVAPLIALVGCYRHGTRTDDSCTAPTLPCGGNPPDRGDTTPRHEPGTGREQSRNTPPGG